MRYKTIAATLLITFTFLTFAEGLPDLGDVSEAALSNNQERQLGEEAMREIRADKSYLDDPELTAYIQKLGMRLVNVNKQSNQDFEFFLIEDPSLNAFALPGGFVGVHTGLILAAQNESELAGVLGHEIAHVTQHHIARLIAGQKGSMLTSLAALAIAILAARSSAQMSQAAVVGAQASAIQNQLDFTRTHEQEADRVGIQTMSAAGFDPKGMTTFFERLQRSTRPVESNAPSYLRTHPLTIERIADMENRLDKLPKKQVVSSFDFLMAKAKIRATTGSVQEAVGFFDSGKSSETAEESTTRIYGLARALERGRNYARAEKELSQILGKKPQHPMIDSLAANLKRDQNQYQAALEIYRNALKTFPNDNALFYGQVETLLALKNNNEALKAIIDRIASGQNDIQLYELQSKVYAALGKKLLQHQAQAEVYYRKGNLLAAVEQLQIAVKSNDGDFYQKSVVEVKLQQVKNELSKSKNGQRMDP